MANKLGIACTMSVRPVHLFLAMPESVYHTYRIPSDPFSYPHFNGKFRNDPILVLQPDILFVLYSPCFGNLWIYPHTVFIHKICKIGIIGRTAESMHGSPSIIQSVETFRRFSMWCIFRKRVETKSFK